MRTSPFGATTQQTQKGRGERARLACLRVIAPTCLRRAIANPPRTHGEETRRRANARDAIARRKSRSRDVHDFFPSFLRGFKRRQYGNIAPAVSRAANFTLLRGIARTMRCDVPYCRSRILSRAQPSVAHWQILALRVLGTRGRAWRTSTARDARKGTFARRTCIDQATAGRGAHFTRSHARAHLERARDATTVGGSTTNPRDFRRGRDAVTATVAENSREHEDSSARGPTCHYYHYHYTAILPPAAEAATTSVFSVALVLLFANNPRNTIARNYRNDPSDGKFRVSSTDVEDARFLRG